MQSHHLLLIVSIQSPKLLLNLKHMLLEKMQDCEMRLSQRSEWHAV